MGNVTLNLPEAAEDARQPLPTGVTSVGYRRTGSPAEEAAEVSEEDEWTPIA